MKLTRNSVMPSDIWMLTSITHVNKRTKHKLTPSSSNWKSMY